MDIAVINLMRLGDLIQTSPVIRRLRCQHPNSRVTLVAKDLFQETARLLPGVDRLVAFPSIPLATLVDQDGRWPEAAQRLEAWLKESFPCPPDLVINLTPSLMGGILAYATGGREIRGVAVNRAWELGTQPHWASYALIISRVRQANPFNLVDLFLREGRLWPDGHGLEAAVPPEAEDQAEAFFQGLKLPEDTALVGLFPGASRPERCWPPDRLARTAQLLLENRPCHFFIFGSSGEAPLGEAVFRQIPGAAATPLWGRTSPAMLAAYLKRLHLLITNDTGPMHLAAAVGTPTLALFLASARVQDTGPVGKGHVILEPRLDCHPCLIPCPWPRCQQAISPEAVAEWASRILGKKNLAPLDDNPIHRTVRAWMSTTDPQGYHAYLPLVRRPLGRRDFWLWLHRAAWGEALDGSKFSGAPLQTWLQEVLCRHYLPPREDLGGAMGEEGLQELCQNSSRGEQLVEEIIRWAGNGKDFPVRVWQKIEALGAVDQNLRRIGVAFPELAALVEFFFQEQRGRYGTEIIPLARELQGAYARLRRLGESMSARLADLKIPLGLSETKVGCGEMAQTVQARWSNTTPLPPESEGASCR